MTFEEWWEQLEVFRMPEDERQAVDFARIAWESATKAEREACAKVCDTQAGNTKDFRQDFRRGAGHCAAAIRAR